MHSGHDFRVQVKIFKYKFLSSPWSNLGNVSVYQIENFLNFSKLTQVLSIGQRAVREQSESSQRAVRKHSESTQRALREHSESTKRALSEESVSTQSIKVIVNTVRAYKYFVSFFLHSTLACLFLIIQIWEWLNLVTENGRMLIL